MSIQVIQSEAELDKFIKGLEAENSFSLEFSFDARQIKYLAIGSKEHSAIFINSDANYLNRILANLTVHVFVFDLKQIYKKTQALGIVLPPKCLDLMIASYVENSSVPGDLNSQAKLNLNLDLSLAKPPAPSGIFDDELDQKTKDQIAKRLAAMIQLGRDYLQHLPEQLKHLWLEVENPISIILAKMELGGVHLDKNKLQEVSTRLFEKSRTLESVIKVTLNSPDLNLNSPQQLGACLASRGFDLSKSTTKGGKVSVDKEVLEALEVEDTTGVIKQILEYRTVTKLYSTYTETFLKQLDSTSRLHGEYDQTKVPTGRLSSSNPNLQNIPIRNPEYGPLIRSCFTARDGYVLVGADYSQFELRLLAHFSADPTLIEAFELNQDIHARTAAEIFDIPIDEVTKENRRVSKTINFALVYQQGVFATARQLEIDKKEAKMFMEKYFITFGRVKPFVEEVLAFARSNGYVETFLGRRRFFDNLNSESVLVSKAEERAAFNAVLQGSNADLIKQAMIKIDTEITTQNLDARLVLQVHDELVLEVKADQAETLRKIVIQAMEAQQPLKIPIVVDSGIGPNWNECR